MQTVASRPFPCSVFSLKITKIIKLLNLTDAIIDDSDKMGHVT
jgi:hypothetical protein